VQLSALGQVLIETARLLARIETKE